MGQLRRLCFLDRSSVRGCPRGDRLVGRLADVVLFGMVLWTMSAQLTVFSWTAAAIVIGLWIWKTRRMLEASD